RHRRQWHRSLAQVLSQMPLGQALHPVVGNQIAPFARQAKHLPLSHKSPIALKTSIRHKIASLKDFKLVELSGQTPVWKRTTG
ncbi:Uncharacterized protein DAT39_002167, partial [Clarias magur]